MKEAWESNRKTNLFNHQGVRNGCGMSKSEKGGTRLFSLMDEGEWGSIHSENTANGFPEGPSPLNTSRDVSVQRGPGAEREGKAGERELGGRAWVAKLHRWANNITTDKGQNSWLLRDVGEFSGKEAGARRGRKRTPTDPTRKKEEGKGLGRFLSPRKDPFGS